MPVRWNVERLLHHGCGWSAPLAARRAAEGLVNHTRYGLAGILLRAYQVADHGGQLTRGSSAELVPQTNVSALVDLLGTGDVFRELGSDEWHGSTRSAAQLPTLDHWKWWAIEAGVLRQRQGRLVAVEAWRKTGAERPVG